MTLTTQDSLFEQQMQSVLIARPDLYRHRRPDEMCGHCGAPANEPCRNSFNPNETYTAGHMQKIEVSDEK